MSGEESTIALASDFGKDRGRSMRGIGDKSEPLLSCRPADRRCVFNEITDKVILHVANVVSLLHSMPADVEGDVRRYMVTCLQGIGKGEEILDLHIAEFHRGRCLIEVGIYVLIRDANRPEQAAWSNTGVEVVDLICRDNLPLVEVQSDEGEGAPMPLSIQPNVDTLHKTHVDVEDETALLA